MSYVRKYITINDTQSKLRQTLKNDTQKENNHQILKENNFDIQQRRQNLN